MGKRNREEKSRKVRGPKKYIFRLLIKYFGTVLRQNMKTNIIYRGLYCYLFHHIIVFIWCPKHNSFRPSYGHSEVREEKEKIVQNECRKSEELVLLAE
jgi:hypothetical protein